MLRSDFLKRLLASAILGKLPVELTKQFRKIYLLQCFVAGFRFHQGMELLAEMREGDLLELVREPENEYDDCAISLLWRGQKIGYIPADTNEMLSYLLDARALDLFAVITHLERDARPWENVAIAVYFLQEVNHELPAHANYLTRIEAPHYRTLKYKNRGDDIVYERRDNDLYGKLFDTTDRVINLDLIEQKEVKDYFEKHYSRLAVEMEKPGRYVQVKDDGIYSWMYEISDKVIRTKDKNGKEYLEFFVGG